MVLVGDRVWIFGASGPDHKVTFGYVRNSATFDLIGYFNHNMSHAATVDYSARHDTVMIGNSGDGTASKVARVDLLTGFSSYRPGAFLDFNNTASTPRVSIPLTVFNADGSVQRTVFSDRARRSANAVWIDGPNTILVFGVNASGLNAVTMRLGTGTDDFSATGYGAFIPGKGETEFNGTARVIATYNGPQVGTTQGADWHDRKLFLGLTNREVRQRALEVLELSLVSGGTIATTNRWFYQPQNPDGTNVRFEIEGVLHRGGELIAGAIRIPDEYQSIYRFTDYTTAVDLLP